MSNPRRSRFSISSAATLAITLAASLGACAPLAQARPATSTPTMQWGFTTVADAPTRAGFSDAAQASSSEPVRSGFATTTSTSGATSWGFASVPAMPPSQASPVAARAGGDTSTR